MARTKNHPAAARSAPHAAMDPAPAGAGLAAGSPAAAVCAALAATPGATTAAIAEAAGIGRPAARDALIAMEQAGTATRIKGGKPGIPDTWTITGTGRDDGEPDGQLGTGDEPDEGTGQDAVAEASSPAAPDAEGGEADSSASADPESAKEAQPGDGTAGERDADAGEQGGGTATDDVPTDTPEEVPGDDATPDAEPEPKSESEGTGQPEDSYDAHGEAATPASDGGEADSEQDPALISEIVEHIDQIRAAADAAELVLTANGDLKTALAGLDEACEQAAQARRTLKAALGGRKAPAARPGGLRERVLAHLDAHPGGEFTPHEIHKVLGNSSGAIANALDTLVKHGDAELATEKPRRYRRTAQPATAASEAGEAGSAQDSGELAGAA
jgi:hypothetical protein